MLKYITGFLTSTRLRLAAMLVAVAALSACNSLLYDDQGDCDPYYKVRFVFDMNLNDVDAFHKEVNEVTLHVIDDATGKVVWKKHESGERLRTEGYLMDVDVAPGKYSLVAWCGEGHTTHFTVTPTDEKTKLSCKLTARTPADDPSQGSKVTDDLNRLYHGKLDAQDFPDEQGEHIYTVKLTKNTNDFHIVLQHLSGAPMSKDKFSFRITDTNGHLDWDNSIIPDEQITYHEWYKGELAAESEVPYPTTEAAASRGQQNFTAVVADITTSRLVKGQKTRLNVYNNDTGELIISVPLIDYCLMVKGHYRDMPDQEFLDRKDDYPMTFFLDEGYRWMDSYIYIHSWKVIIQNSSAK